jgi:hypothetical protein
MTGKKTQTLRFNWYLVCRPVASLIIANELSGQNPARQQLRRVNKACSCQTHSAQGMADAFGAQRLLNLCQVQQSALSDGHGRSKEMSYPEKSREQPHFLDLSALSSALDDLDDAVSLEPADTLHSASRTSVATATQRCCERAEATSDTLLVVEPRVPFRVLDVGREWTQLLGIVRASDVTGRSMNFMSGPETDMTTTRSLVEDAKASEQVAQRITVYTRSGDPVQVRVSSSRKGETVALRLAQSRAASPVPNAKLEAILQATFIVDDPHQMCSGTPKCASLNDAVSRCAEHSSATATPQSCCERAEATSDTLLVVEPRPPFRVLDMGREWTQLLGIVSAVTGRSMNFMSGPETDMTTTRSLVEDAKASEQVAQRITVYTRSGDPVQVRVSSSRKGETVALRLAQSQDTSPVPDAKLESLLQATFMVEQPHQMCSGTPAFYDLYQFHQYALNNTNDFQPPAATDDQGCLSEIFGWRTDGQRWKNMIKRAQQGSTVTSCIYTYPSNGNELNTRLIVAPQPGHADRLSLTVELESVSCSDDTEQNSSSDSGASIESLSRIGSAQADRGRQCAYKAMHAYKARKKLVQLEAASQV